jgi:hypothetical protein
MLKSAAKMNLAGRNFFFVLFSFVSCSLLWSVYIDKHLSADGVNYFCYILENKNFTFIDQARQHANFLIEWPIVLALISGVEDVRILSLLFGTGIYLLFLFSFLLSDAVLPLKDKVLLIFPVASMVMINLPGDYILIGEHHAMTLLSWPILFLVMRDDLKLLQYLLLWALLIVYSCLYQSAFFTGLIFLGILAFRIFREWKRERTIPDLITVLLCLAVCVIAFLSVIYPRSEANKDSFLGALPVGLLNRDVMITAAFLGLFAMSMFIRNKKVVFVSLVPIICYITFLIFANEGVTASHSFATRTLSMSILPFMIVFALIFSYYKLKLTKRATTIFAFFVLVMVIGNIYYSKGWIDLHRKFVQTSENNTGFVPIEKTELNNNPCGWVWNNSQLGIVWSASCVKSIILNRPDLKWEPFHPREVLILKDFVKYDPFFLSVDKSITLCKPAENNNTSLGYE